jgi:putative tricarboxylic transport membrane protein
MFNGDRLSGLVLLLCSLVTAIESYRLGVGKIASPLAGFFPFTASIVLAILSLLLLYSTRNKKMTSIDKHEYISFNVQSLPKVVLTIISLFLYAILLDSLGYLLDSAILMAFMLGVIQPQKWHVIAIGGILIPLLTYVLFNVLLKVQLPTGLFGM